MLLGLLGLFLVAALGLWLALRSMLANGKVQAALAAQISKAIGQPVVIGGLGATLYPRVGVRLDDVAIGDKSQITVQSFGLGADLGPLLSRRIEHATVRLAGARAALPLPALTLGSDSAIDTMPADVSTRPPIEIVSVDSVALSGVEIISGGRTLKGDVDIVPAGPGVIVKRIALSAEDMSLTATGTITDLAGPIGDISLRAGELNVDRLLAFFNEFVGGLAEGAPPRAITAATDPSKAVSSMHLNVAIEAERATFGTLAIERLTGRAIADDRSVTIAPLRFGLFGGTYDGGLTVTLGTAQPTFRWKAAVEDIDVAAATAFAGSPNAVSGRLTGTVDLNGTGRDASTAMSTAAGTVRLAVTDGVVRNLGIVRSVGAATSLSLESLRLAAARAADVDEPFSKLSATVTIADGAASTGDLRFDAADLVLIARGSVALDSSALNLRGRVELSEALSGQVHHTMLRLSKDDGRVVLPAVITGSVASPIVKIDSGDIAKRALRNTVTTPPLGLLKGLGGLVGR